MRAFVILASAVIRLALGGDVDETLCGSDGDPVCPDPADYCDRTPEPCSLDASGICRWRPEICETSWTPVCGCDGRTYSNDCTAAADGIGVSHAGTCVNNGDNDRDGAPSFRPSISPSPVLGPRTTSSTSAPPCSESKRTVRIEIRTDGAGDETSWDLTRHESRDIIESVAGGAYGDDETRTTDVCVEPGMYTLTVRDAWGDGMCCVLGDGSFWVYVLEDDRFEEKIHGGLFGFESRSHFIVDDGGYPSFITTPGCEEECSAAIFEEGSIPTGDCDSSALAGCECVYSDRFCSSECDPDMEAWLTKCIGAGPAPVPVPPPENVWLDFSDFFGIRRV